MECRNKKNIYIFISRRNSDLKEDRTKFILKKKRTVFHKKETTKKISDFPLSLPTQLRVVQRLLVAKKTTKYLVPSPQPPPPSFHPPPSPPLSFSPQHNQDKPTTPLPPPPVRPTCNLPPPPPYGFAGFARPSKKINKSSARGWGFFFCFLFFLIFPLDLLFLLVVC